MISIQVAFLSAHLYTLIQVYPPPQNEKCCTSPEREEEYRVIYFPANNIIHNNLGTSYNFLIMIKKKIQVYDSNKQYVYK